MSEVRRIAATWNDVCESIQLRPSPDGEFVNYKDYAALQQKLDAVLAENVALKEQCAGEMSRAANDIAYAIFNLADMKMTDLKPGIIESTGPAETALIAERNLRNATARLRAETDTTFSQYESLAGGK